MTLEGKVGAEIGGINLLIVNFSGHPHNCSNLLERIAVAIFTHKSHFSIFAIFPVGNGQDNVNISCGS